MLSRVAENLYWLGRHLERAENAARMVHVEYLTAVESGDVGGTSGSFWEPLLKASGASDAFRDAVVQHPDLSPAFFLILAEENANSVRSSIVQARNLARAARELISREVWEEINELHLSLQARTMVREDELYDLCNTVKRGVETTIGLYDHTVLRDEGAEWFQCGLYIERADMTSRILDTKYHVLLPALTEIGGPLDRFQWMAVLRSASAWEAFRKLHRADISGPRVADMLIFEPAFPRSLAFCVHAFGEHFRRATVLTPPTDRLPAERIVTLLELDLRALNIDRVLATGLHEFLDDFQRRLFDVQVALAAHIFKGDPGVHRMIVTVEWHSTYRYSTAVRQVHNELRVVPATRDGQQRLSVSLTTDPPARLIELTDAFGNEYHYFDLLGEVSEFSASLHATVSTASDVVRIGQPSALMQFLMLQPTHRCPFDPRVGDLLRAAGAGGGPLSMASRVMSVISERFIFEVGQTTVGDTAIELLDHGRGVCQDFAHLMLATLRMGGVPARYVSGYLAPESGVTVGDASHAWVQVYADGAWHGFDPSGQRPQDEHYIVSGVGRDYDDVPPLRGSYRGTAEQAWQASVQIATQQ